MPLGLALCLIALPAALLTERFESAGPDRVPAGWQFHPGQSSTCALDERAPHSGRRSLRLTYAGATGAGLFATLERTAPIPVTPGRPYTLSAWVRTGQPVRAWIGGGAGWGTRLMIPATQGSWQRVALVFVPGPGEDRFVLRVTVESASDGIWIDDLKLEPGALATDGGSISVEQVRARGAALRTRLGPLASAIARLGQPARLMTTLTVIEDQLGYLAVDPSRPSLLLEELEGMTVRLEHDTAAGSAARLIPGWTASARPRVDGSSLLGATSSGRERPLFFTGFGFFDQVVRDLARFPRYGVNLIAIGLGPDRVFPREGVVDRAPIDALVQVLDRARQARVAVDLLVSPHYLPRWFLERHPELVKRRTGFLQYCLHAPEGQRLLAAFLEELIPRIRDHPALLSICLSNEPMNLEEPCQHAVRAWHAWLERRHGSIEKLNQRWSGAHHARFADIPLPDPLRPPARVTPVWMDFVRFNQDWFAGWHEQLAATIHRLAPDLPVHVKATASSLLAEGEVSAGVDATSFARLSGLLGHDSTTLQAEPGAELAQSWQQGILAIDLLRSIKQAPVIDSENHLIADRDPRAVSPRHLRAAIWQAAIHGQAATALWVWERSLDPASDFFGSILHRPTAIEAVGWVNQDLNRLAHEVVALQRAPRTVTLLHSTTAMVWDGARHTDSLQKVHAALLSSGLVVDFITERQLESGRLPSTALLILPEVSHLSEAARGTLERYRGRLVAVGAAPSRDEYDRAARALPIAERLPYRHGLTGAQAVFAAIGARLPAWKLAPRVQLSGAPLGVVWRSAEHDGRTLVDVCNYLGRAVRVRLTEAGRPAAARDLLDDRAVSGWVTLEPLEVRLLELAAR